MVQKGLDWTMDNIELDASNGPRAILGSALVDTFMEYLMSEGETEGK